MLLNHLYDNTIKFSNSISKSARKKIGQFFTPPPVASYMANLVDVRKSSIKILDPGAGTALLSGAICEHIVGNKYIQSVHIDLFEIDANVIPVLQTNLMLIREFLEMNDIEFTFNIIRENFILYHELFWKGLEHRQEDELYDVVISNPPYKKIGKSDEEAIVMDSIVYGQPNIYFLFLALSSKLLKQEGQMIFITPRSFSSGLYFRKFREYFLNAVRLTNLHLFHSRDDVFDSDKILQEAIILRAVKSTSLTDTILISASENMHMDENTAQEVPYSTVIDMGSPDLFIMIPTTDSEIELLTIMKYWEYNLLTLGFKIKTGPVVDFRATEFLREEEAKSTVPLLFASHFSDHQISFPISYSKNPQYIINTKKSKGLLLESKDYILVKRFTSKEEKRRVQCALYWADKFGCDVIGIENHLNYIAKLNDSMTNEEMYGLFALLNSSFIDTYYRVLNGSTQVNATEVNAIPMPSLEDIKQIGRLLMNADNISTETCDTIIGKMVNGNQTVRCLKGA